MAANRDSGLATSADFFMATDIGPSDLASASPSAVGGSELELESRGLRVRCSASLHVHRRSPVQVTALGVPAWTVPDVGELQLKLQLTLFSQGGEETSQEVPATMSSSSIFPVAVSVGWGARRTITMPAARRAGQLLTPIGLSAAAAALRHGSNRARPRP